MNIAHNDTLQNRMKHFFFIGLSICLLVLLLYKINCILPTKAKAADNTTLGYYSVSITTHDTLWSIAKKNYDSQFGSLNDYIQEIKRCNSLTSDNINAGSSLIVPIYYIPEQS